MQRVTMVRYAVKTDRAAENEALSRAVFEELRVTAPRGVAYGLFRNGDEFVHLFVNLRDDNSDAVTELPSFKAYQAGILDRCDTPPQPIRLSLERVDSYGLAEEPQRA